MEKTIALEDQVICVTGTDNNKAWYKKLDAAGVKTTKSIAKKTTLVIARATWGRLCTEARLKGLPIIDEKKAETLLSTGEVTITVEDEPEGESISTQIAEARAILDGTPDHTTWVALVKLVDETASEQLGELVDYLDPIISRWTPGPDEYTSLDGGLGHSDFIFWDRGLRPGEICIMPPMWVSQALAQGPDERLKLVRSIVMSEIPFKLTGLKKMLDSPHLTNLRSLFFGEGESLRLSPSFYKKLPKMNGTKELESLVLNSWNEKSLAALDAWSEWPSVRRIGFNGHGRSALLQHRDEKHITALYRSAFGQQITALQIDTGTTSGYFDYGLADLTAESLPNLERLEIYATSVDYLHRSIERAALVPREVPTLALMGPVGSVSSKSIEALVSRELPMYTTLDLSTLGFTAQHADKWFYLLENDEREGVEKEDAKTKALALFRQRFAEHFANSPLAESIDSVHLGSTLYDPDFAEKLGDAGVEVV